MSSNYQVKSKSATLGNGGAWRRFIHWLNVKADRDGWAQTTSPELASVLYPKPWAGTDTDAVSHKIGTLREWQRAGLVIETGAHEYAVGEVQHYAVGLTMKGVATCRDNGMAHPPSVAPTPLSVGRETAPPEREQEPITQSPKPVITRVDRRPGPPVEVTEARTQTMRDVRDALTYALYLTTHPQTCERKHTEDYTAEELFELAVTKAKSEAEGK